MKRNINKEERHSLLKNQSEISHFIKAKYKGKYYNCRILQKGIEKSKIIFLNCNWKTTVNNKDILF